MARKGRPTKEAKPGTRASLGLKVTASLKARLEQEAAKTGRTQSQEAEHRLEQSFERLDLVPQVLEAAYGRQLAGLLMVIGRVMADAGSHGGFLSTGRSMRQDWPEDALAYDLATKALSHVLDAFRPVAPVEPSKLARTFEKATGLNHDGVARGWAAGAIDAIAGRPATSDDKRFADAVRPLLGRLAVIEDGEAK